MGGNSKVEKVEIRVHEPETVAGRERKGNSRTSRLVEGEPRNHRMEATLVKVIYLTLCMMSCHA